MKPKTQTHGALLCSFLFILCIIAASPARATAPADQIRGTINKVLEVLKDPNLKADGKKKLRLERLRELIEPQFDFSEMAKRSLGAHWQWRSAEEQREFVKLFTELLETGYILLVLIHMTAKK